MPLFAREIQIKPIAVDDIKPESIERLRSALRKCPVFVADNVANYIEEQSTGGKPVHIGSIAPPFPEFWVEYRDGRTAEKISCGIFFEASSQPPWKLHASLFITSQRMSRILPVAIVAYDLDEQGHGAAMNCSYMRPVGNVSKEEHKQVIGGYLGIAFLTITFLHCKNVVRVEHTRDPALVKRCRERGNPLPLKYHTIEIEPMKEILRKEGRIETEGLERALHICRGHFAHYADDGPGLFGRGLHGNFWIPAHARGTEKKGAVISDYNVNVPKEPVQ